MNSQLSVISEQLSVISEQLPVISNQLLVARRAVNRNRLFVESWVANCYQSLFVPILKLRKGRTLPITVYCLLLTVYCSLLTDNCVAQSPAKYLITLKDKANSPYSVSKPLEFLSQRSVNRRTKQNIPVVTRDLPVNPAYLTEIRKTGAKVWYSSRWMNAVMVECKDAVLQTILKLPFVKGLEIKGSIDDPEQRKKRKSAKFETHENKSFNYGSARIQNEMIGVDVMHEMGFRGEGMMIGVLDSGFDNVDSVMAFKPLFDEKRVVGTYDFVKNEVSVYEDDDHGTEVLSCMGAFLEGELVGTAPKASYLLLRTEDDFSEYIIEEANWLFAAEYADSVGVDLINSSLGYTTFDDISTNHTYEQLNGNTTIAARAADWAASVGIICVVSAGNESQNAWRYISTPADADSIIAVGAVDVDGRYSISSSQGIPTDKRIKPDLVAMGRGVAFITSDNRVAIGSGTSFSSPILCGMIAGYWQANPTLTAMQVMENVRKSGSQAAKPDKVLGYGIPNKFKKDKKTLFFVYPNPTKNDITIEINDFNNFNYQFNLYDVLGKSMLSGIINIRIQSISLKDIPTGLYFLRVGNEGKNSVVRVIVK